MNIITEGSFNIVMIVIVEFEFIVSNFHEFCSQDSIINYE